MKSTKWLILVLLLTATTAHAQSVPQRIKTTFSLSYQSSHDVLYGGSLFDLGTTMEGIQNGRREVNPFFRSGSRPVIAASVIGSTVAVDIATHYLARHGHRKLAAAFNYGIGGMHGLAGIYNVK